MSREKNGEPTAQSVDKQSFDRKNGKKRKRVGPLSNQKDDQALNFETPNDTANPISRKAASYKRLDSDSEQPTEPLEKPIKRPKSDPSPPALKSDPRASQPSQPSNRTPGNQQHSKHSQGVPPHLLRKRDELLPIRKSLPIWPQANAIKAALKKNNILVLTGETGSGKSTQVPQFLVNEPWCTKCIAITQPRRVAAISLARRVAEEMGSFMGSQSPAAKVGYSVRFDNATGPNTRIKFLTEGMLLQEMLRDPIMSQYSAVVVDEVHERSVNVDLILGFLQNLVSGVEAGAQSTRAHPLKVIVMSATADVESLVSFFEDGHTSPKPKQTADKPKNESKGAVAQKDGTMLVKPGPVSTCFVEGRQYPVKTVYLPQPTQDWVESALKIIFQIHYKEPLPGDILVFLTGQDTIEGLEKLVNDYAEGMDKDVPKVSQLLIALSTTTIVTH